MLLFDGIGSLIYTLDILTESCLSREEKLDRLYVYNIVAIYVFLFIFRVWLGLCIFMWNKLGTGFQTLLIQSIIIYTVLCTVRVPGIHDRQEKLKKDGKLNLYKIAKKYYERKTE